MYTPSDLSGRKHVDLQNTRIKFKLRVNGVDGDKTNWTTALCVPRGCPSDIYT